MSKLNEEATSSGQPDAGNHGKTEEEELETKEDSNEVDGSETKDEKSTKPENDKSDILKFTMLFNKYNYVLDSKRNSRNSRSDEDKRDNKVAMFFNKEVTIRRDPEAPSIAAKLIEVKKFSGLEKESRKPSRSKSKFYPASFPVSEFGLISYPGMPFTGSLTSASSDALCVKPRSSSENLKTFFSKRNPKGEIDALMQLSGHPEIRKDLRIYKSLTILTKNNKIGIRGALKSKIASLTALDSNSGNQKTGTTRFSYWEHWDDLNLMSDVDKRLNLQISRSSYDNSRRSASKFKKEDAASVSDSKLLNADSDSKTHIKKCDKKSRGDSSRKERESGSRKQVQWNTEVDVIYFSIQMAANGDRSGEVIGRVMEPLREEWEQQRKGFYAKLVPSQMESHIKDRFISLLKI